MPTTNGRNFIQGNAGEAYVRRHIQELLAHGFVSHVLNTSSEAIEGGDNRIKYYRFGDPVNTEEYALALENISSSEGYNIAEILVGGLEVKTINDFTFRTNDMNELSGTLYFELWHEKNRMSYGWLPALLHPEIRLKPELEQPIRAVQPVLLCFLLISYLGPFACVMFEDFPALAQRLNELAAEKGFKLVRRSEDPQGIPIGSDAQTWRQDDPYIINNNWHIPFERLSDLATVTLIGDMPLKKHSFSLDPGEDERYLHLQQQRYDYLKQCAGDRSIPSETQSESEFRPVDENYIFANILKNITIIKDLSADDYPYLYQALRSRGMRDHLNVVLLNMYAHNKPTIINERMIAFLQTKTYLHKWGKNIGVSGSTFSWQSHLIFLMDAELITKFVDTTKPINEQTYRTVHIYTPDVLRFADEKAKKYLDAGINLNNFTKAEVIRVSGQERADFLYFGDERIVSTMQETLEGMFITVANQHINENGYGVPSEIIKAVRDQVNELYWVDPWEDENTECFKTYKQAKAELVHLQKTYKALSRMIPCDYRRLTKEEKIRYQLPTRFTKIVYTR